MDTFNMLFGTKASKIKKTCVLIPFLTKEMLREFGIERLSKGLLYSSGDNGSFNVIHTGIGPTPMGDAVLYLEETLCENLVMFGACGAARETKDLSIGNMVTIEKALSQDSFTNTLLKNNILGEFYPDKTLYNKTLSGSGKRDLKKAECLSIGSLKLEGEYLKYINNKSIDVLDMEAAPFFAACSKTGKKSLSFLFITDILGKFPYYMPIKKENRELLQDIISKSASLLCAIIEKNLLD